MEGLLYASTFIAALGSGLVAGIFLAFSAFVMTALGRLPQAAGISAMQSINVAVLNPVFFTAFFGTGAICFLLAIAAFVQWPQPGSGYLVAGCLLYLVGCVAVTVAFNVPLNTRLAAVQADCNDAADLWKRYLTDWTNWNHVRTAASLAAAAAFIKALR